MSIILKIIVKHGIRHVVSLPNRLTTNFPVSTWVAEEAATPLATAKLAWAPDRPSGARIAILPLRTNIYGPTNYQPLFVITCVLTPPRTTKKRATRPGTHHRRFYLSLASGSRRETRSVFNGFYRRLVDPPKVLLLLGQVKGIKTKSSRVGCCHLFFFYQGNII